MDFFNRDFLQFFNSPINSNISKDITIVNIDSNTDGFSSPLRYSELEKLILEIKKHQPKAVLLNIEPLDFTENIEERKKLRNILEENKIYLNNETMSRFGKIRFFEDPIFSKYQFKYPDSYAMDDNTYFSARRLLIAYYGDSSNSTLHDSLPPIGINFKPIDDFKYAFERMNTLQIFIKFYRSTDFNNLNAQDLIDGQVNPDVIKNKIITIGRIDEFSYMDALNPLNLLGKSQASSNLKDNIVPLHHILANQISTLQTGDYVKYVNGQYVHIILTVVLILLILLKLEPQIKLYVFLLILPASIFLQILTYIFSSFYIDMVPTFIMLISVQYLAIPLILLAMFKQKEQQKLQAVNNARIDALLSVSEKVAHDIRSPLGAINLILSRTKFENPEHKEIVNNAIQRIDGSAENILQKYKFKNDNRIDSLEKIEINNLLKNLAAEKQILDENIKYQLETENTERLLVYGFSVELERVISNTIDNSIHALKKTTNPLIKISTDVSNNDLILKIYDNGIGITPSILQLLGNEQITTKNKDRGHGIGVLHAKRTIERMNGSLLVESNENVYSQVTIKLQLAT